MQAQRNLKDYKNSDGLAPNGLDDATDDTYAFRAALADGPGTVCAPPGFYRCGNVTIPPQVTLQGSAHASVISSNGAERIFLQENVNAWKISSLVLQGPAQADWRTRRNLAQAGLHIDSCLEFELSALTVSDFDGPGIYLTNVSTSSPFRSNARLFNITANRNYIGIHFDQRAEYISAAMLGCDSNTIGCLINSGNVNITNSHFNSNRTGLHIEDKDNGSHGSISNSLVNHNQTYALVARNVKYGMAIDNCAFFCGQTVLDNSVGVNITSGIISCNLTCTCPRANRIAGNYIIPQEYNFDFSPSTIVKDNFTADGPWDQNR